MAKYYRYMSVFEFIRMSLGDEIRPFIDYSSAYLTTSKGVCFLGDHSFDENDGEKNSMQAIREYIKDCVSDHILVEFESTDSADIHESFGKYPRKRLPEYWTESYDLKRMIPTKYKIAIAPDIDKCEWIDYNRDAVLQNPKAVLGQIANQRRIHKKTELTDLEDWCCELSLLSDDNNGWYIEKDANNKTVTLAYGDLKERKPNFSLSFTQESSDALYEGLRKYSIGNYSWKISGDIPDTWKDLDERLEKISKNQSDSMLYYARSAEPNTICDYDYSLMMPCFRISQLMKYSMLKTIYPDIIDQYDINLDKTYSGRIIEPLGLLKPQSAPGVLPIRLDTLRINEVGFVLNNLYSTNPIFFSSKIKNRSHSEKQVDREECFDENI